MPSSSGSYSPPQDESPPTEGSSITAAPPPLYILEDIFFMPTPPFQPQQCKPPPPQPLSAAVREAIKTIDMELASDNPHLPPPFMIEAANQFEVSVENLFSLPSPSPPRSPPPVEQEVDLEQILVDQPLPVEAVQYFGVELNEMILRIPGAELPSFQPLKEQK
jgi:hypothetical protein